MSVVGRQLPAIYPSSRKDVTRLPGIELVCGARRAWLSPLPGGPCVIFDKVFPKPIHLRILRNS
jgi:hypothetical protein